MIKAGLFKKFPRPSYALALHVDASTETGTATLNSGPVTANVDSMEITMIGKDGHGARPQDTIDPIPMASELVLSMQTLVSREKDPSDPAVVTVGSFHSGTKHNIISASAILQLTIRTFTDKTRMLIIDGIKRKARAIAQAYKAPEPKITSSEATVPSVQNSPVVVEKIRPVFERVIGPQKILQSEPWTVGEDFSFYGAEGIPSVLFSIGTISSSRMKAYKKKNGPPGLHSGTYYPSSEESMQTGIPLLAESAIALFNAKD
jgi:hippurate hydrolase